MYLRSSKYRMERKKSRRFNPALIIIGLLAIAGIIIFQTYVIPTVPKPYVPTVTPTRSAASFAEEAANLFEQGKLQSSIDMYQQAIRIDPKNADLYINLSRVQVFARAYPDALENAQNAVLRSKSALAYAVYGNALQYVDRYDDSEQELRRSLLLDPNLALAHAYLAEELMNADSINNYKEAKSEAMAAIALGPNLLESHRAMGYVWMLTGNQELAIGEFQAAISMNSKLAQLYIWLGDMQVATQQVTEGIDSYTTASSLDSTDPTPPARIARAYAGDGQYGKAAQYAESAVLLDPINPRMHGLLGVMYYYNRNFAGAITELNLAIAGGPVEVKNDAGTPATEMVAGLPLGPLPISEYYWTFGLALAKAGRCAEALPVLHLVQQTFPDDETANDNITQGLLICKEITPTPAPAP